ncbi:MAG: DUF6265 family protein [Gammaproteobacteria bacterium]
MKRGTIVGVMLLAAPWGSAVSASSALPDPLAAGWEGEPVCEALHEKPDLRVLRCTFPPGGGHDRHFHPAHFGYALSGGRMQIVSGSGEREVSLPDDSSYASDGVEWHEVRNVGETTVRYLIVEPRVESTASQGPFSWLEGHWCGGDDERGFEEMWMPAVHGETVGVGRTLRAGRTTSVEHLKIARQDGVPTLFARPEGQPSVAFAQTEEGETWARFENPAHDFPTFIEYRRTGDALVAAIGDGSGKRRVFEYAPCRSRR